MTLLLWYSPHFCIQERRMLRTMCFLLRCCAPNCFTEPPEPNGEAGFQRKCWKSEHLEKWLFWFGTQRISVYRNLWSHFWRLWTLLYKGKMYQKDFWKKIKTICQSKFQKSRDFVETLILALRATLKRELEESASHHVFSFALLRADLLYRASWI